MQIGISEVGKGEEIQTPLPPPLPYFEVQRDLGDSRGKFLFVFTRAQGGRARRKQKGG